MTSGKYVALNVFLWAAEGVGLVEVLDDKRVVDEERGEGEPLPPWLATRRDGWGNVM